MAAQQKLSQPPTSKDKTFDQWIFWLWQRVVAAGQSVVSALSFTQTKVVAGRNSAGAGTGEEVTATQVLDWLSSTANRILYRGASAWGDSSAFTFDGTTLSATKFAGALNGTVGATTPATGAFTDLSSTGNTTIGDASGDTLTVNANSWSIPNGLTASLPMGTLSTGVTNILSWTITYTGDTGGATAARGTHYAIQGNGGNAVLEQRTIDLQALWNGTATNSLIIGFDNQVGLLNSGNSTQMWGYASFFSVASSGSTTNAYSFHAASPQITSTGTITLLAGLRVNNLGNAKVTTAIGVKVEDFTGSTNMYGTKLSLSSGTGKYNLYCDGTADNFLEGKVKIGATAETANGTGTVTVGNLAPGTTAITIQEWWTLKDHNGNTRYIPLFG